jgi:hypothetical protein
MAGTNPAMTSSRFNPKAKKDGRTQMPDIKTDDGCITHVEVEGPQNGPVLMLSNSLGTNLHMWDE